MCRVRYRRCFYIPRYCGFERLNPDAGSNLLIVVGLTGADSKRYKAILRAKNRAIKAAKPLPVPLPTGETGSEDRCVDQFGATSVNQLRQTQKWLSAEEVEQVISEYKEGKTTYELAERFGCHRQTISATLKKHGVEVDKCKARKKLDTDVVVAMYAEMRTTEEIAGHFGVSSYTVNRCLRENGVKIRSRWDYAKK